MSDVVPIRTRIFGVLGTVPMATPDIVAKLDLANQPRHSPLYGVVDTRLRALEREGLVRRVGGGRHQPAGKKTFRWALVPPTPETERA